MTAEHRWDSRAARQRAEPGRGIPLLVSLLLAISLTLLLVPAAQAGGLGFGGPQVNLIGIDCASPGDCTAVGNYYDALGHGQTAAWTETNGVWATGVHLKAPSNAAVNPFDFYGNGGQITYLSCPRAENCSAVGEYLDPALNLRAVLFSERNGKWSTVAAKMPGNVFLAKHRGPNPSGAEVMSGISCWSVGNCIATGYFIAKHGPIQTVFFVEKGGSWGSAQSVRIPSGGYYGDYALTELTAIDCTAGGACTAVGTFTDGAGNLQGWAVTISGGKLQSSRKVAMPTGPSTPDPNPAPQLSSISCNDASDCVATANYSVDYNGHSNGNLEGAMLTERAGTWTAAEVKLPGNAAGISSANAQDTSPLSVDCPDINDCSAAGYYTDTSANIQGEVLDFSTSTWGNAVQVPLPGNASTSSLSQIVLPAPVSCSAAGYCAASSVYVSAGGSYLPLLAYKAGGAWTSTPMMLPSNAGVDQEVGGLGGVSCPTYDPPTVATRNDCTVIGIYEDHSSNIEGFATSEKSNGTWGTPTELTVPGPTRAELRLSLNSVFKPKGRRSHPRQIAKRHGYTFRYKGVQPGKLTIKWHAVHRHRRHLIARVTVKVRKAGRVTTKVKLTSYGRTLLPTVKRLRVKTRITFRPRGRRAAVLTGAFTLRK